MGRLGWKDGIGRHIINWVDGSDGLVGEIDGGRERLWIGWTDRMDWVDGWIGKMGWRD